MYINCTRQQLYPALLCTLNCVCHSAFIHNIYTVLYALLKWKKDLIFLNFPCSHNNIIAYFHSSRRAMNLSGFSFRPAPFYVKPKNFIISCTHNHTIYCYMPGCSFPHYHCCDTHCMHIYGLAPHFHCIPYL